MADNNDELKLKITLDDGSIQEGFLRINRAAKDTGKKVEGGLSDGVAAFADGLNQVAPTAVGVGQKVLAALSSPLGLVTASVVGIGFAFKQAFDLTLEGENLKKIDTTFNSLTQQFGIAGDTLRTQFVGSLKGLVDDSDAVQSLNKAIITLGSRAAQLPQVMDLARKATKLFGGEVIDNFEAINQAVATGATRQLRGLGIIINAEDAYKKFAKAQNIAVSALSEAGKQQAILNEVLAKGGERFKSVSGDADTAGSAYKRFKVAAQNAFEEIAVSVSNSLTPAFAAGLNAATTFATDFGNLFKEPDKAVVDFTESQNHLTDALVQYQAVVDRAKKNEGGIFSAIFGTGQEDAQQKVDQLTAQLATIDQKIEASFLKEAAAFSKKKSVEPEAFVDDSANKKGKKAAALEFTAFLLSQDQARLQAADSFQQLLLTKEISATEKLNAFRESQNIKTTILEQQRNQEIAAINEKYKVDNFFSEEQKLAAIEAINLSFEQKRLEQIQSSAKAEKELGEQAGQDQLTGYSYVFDGIISMFDGAKEAAQDFADNSVMKFKEVGKQALAALGAGVGNAFSKFGAALAQGKNSGEAFAKSLGESLAQAASMFGDFFIQMGIARAASTYGLDATAYTMLGAGIALKILAGAATAGKAAPEVDSGGGISSSPSGSTNLTPATDLQNQKPGTQVQVVIQGNIMDSDESGSRIVDLINQAFDKKGVTIQQGAFA